MVHVMATCLVIMFIGGASQAFADEVNILPPSSETSSWSWTEKEFRENIPTAYLQHKTGVVLPLTDDDVNAAITFGKADKDGRAVEYAYLIKRSVDNWGNNDAYVKIQTPLFLVAEHSRKMAREYRDEDVEFISYCKALDVAHISIWQQAYSKSGRAAGLEIKLILLRDGKRVEPVQMMRGYKGGNPYGKVMSHQLQAVAERNRKNARQFIANMSPSQKEQAIANARASGLSESKINELFAQELPEQTSVASNEISVAELDGIYAISDLKIAGKYEIIFRTLPSSHLFVKGDKEIRFPISFDEFK